LRTIRSVGRRQWRSLCLAAIFALAACATPMRSTASDQASVFIRFRFPGAVCAGLCPHFETEVSPAGIVTTHQLFDGETTQFQARPAKHRRFLRMLDRLRPSGTREADANCVRATGPDGNPDPLYDPRPDDIEVRWSVAGETARLTACDSNRPIREAVQDALRALGADPYFGKKAGWADSLGD
jgi:hypothetical protein